MKKAALGALLLIALTLAPVSAEEAKIGLPLLYIFLMSFLAVFLLWGVGVYVGIHSHYGPFPLLGVVVLSVSGYFTLKSAMANTQSHALIVMGLFGSIVAQSLAQACVWVVQLILRAAPPDKRDQESVEQQ